MLKSFTILVILFLLIWFSPLRTVNVQKIGVVVFNLNAFDVMLGNAKVQQLGGKRDLKASKKVLDAMIKQEAINIDSKLGKLF